MTSTIDQFTEFARKNPNLKFNSLMGLIFGETGLRESFHRLPGNKAAGSDGIRKNDYAEELDDRLRSLSTGLRQMSYLPKPVRRVYIPKANGGQRPLGIPAFEDRIVQDRISKILQAIWEPEFLPFSFGFRPKKGAYDALRVIDKSIMKDHVRYVVEADIKGFFNNVDHSWMMKFIAHRIEDPRFLRLVRRFLKGGIIEDGAVKASDMGTPQGRLVSPVLSNIYLHYVLDLWFERRFKRRLKGRAQLVRFADDFLATFEFESDARLFMAEMQKHLGEFGLETEESKTKLVPFGKEALQNQEKGIVPRETFSFLGFTHFMRRNRKGLPMLDRTTEAKRVRRKLNELSEKLAKLRLKGTDAMFQFTRNHYQGHLQYFGISGNVRALKRYRSLVLHYLFKWLNRRSQRRSLTWDRFMLHLNRIQILRAHIIHQIWG